MEQGNLLAADLTEDDPETAVKGLLCQAQDLLSASRRMMDAFETAGRTGIVSAQDAAALETALADLNKSLPDGDQLQQSAAEIQRALYVTLEKTERALEKLEDAMKHAEENAPALEDARQAALSAAKELRRLAADLTRLADRVPGSILQSQLGDIAAKCTELAEKLERMASADVQGLLADCDALVKSLRAMADRLPVTEGALRSDLNLVMGQLSDTLDGVKDLSADARAIRSALGDVTQSLDVTMGLLRPAA